MKKSGYQLSFLRFENRISWVWICRYNYSAVVFDRKCTLTWRKWIPAGQQKVCEGRVGSSHSHKIFTWDQVWIIMSLFWRTFNLLAFLHIASSDLSFVLSISVLHVQTDTIVLTYSDSVLIYCTVIYLLAAFYIRFWPRIEFEIRYMCISFNVSIYWSIVDLFHNPFTCYCDLWNVK